MDYVMRWIPAYRNKGKVKIGLIDNLKSWKLNLIFPGTSGYQGIMLLIFDES